MTHITIKNLAKSFGAKTILNDLSLDVEKGKSLVVLGGSGTGKSVLLKVILGLLAPDIGSSVIVDGQETTRLSTKKRAEFLKKFGMLFQGGALFDSLTIWENITFGVNRTQKISQKQSIEMAIDLLTQIGLSPDTAFLYPSELSGGMQKRVSLARAICSKPEIIFFDEPTAGLDPIMAGVINKLIRTTVDRLGITAITITHDMTSMQEIADEVAILYEKKILWHGPQSQIWGSQHPYIHNFIRGIAA